MEKTEDIHWTENEEQLERFVLNRLSPGERRELEDHLRTCEACQRAVRDERTLAAGIRALGRDQLKTRVKQRLPIKQPQQVPWQRLVGVAAVLFVLVGIGIHNGWFASRGKDEVMATDEKNLQEGERPLSFADRGKSGQEESKSREFVRREPPAPATHAEGPAGRLQGQLKKNDFPAGKPAESSIMEKDIAGKKEAASPRAIEAASETDRRSDELGEAAASTSQTLWVEGNVLPQPPTAVQRQSLNKMAAQQQKGLSAGSRDKTGPELRDQAANVRNVDGQTFILKQRQAAALPAAQQSKQAKVRGNKVQTQVEKTARTLNLTIYLDTLADEEELQNANIEPVTDDSLIVDFANKRIGYRIPGGWNTNQTQKAKIQK